jgi:type I restriction enzyme R subunit
MPSFIDISEKNLEATIEAVLLADGPDAAQADQNMVREELRSYGAGRAPFGGFRKRLSKQYDRTSCLIEDDAVDFVADTQPEQWRKLRKLYPGDAREQFLARLSKEITKRGTLDVLRKGIRLEGCAFRLAYFTPSTSLNDDLHRRHEANIFAVARQLICSTKGGRELDLALFLNGLPLFTVELKNPLTHQSVEDAIVQYKATRDPHEPLFAFGRCLAHFAVSTDEVYMTTHLRGSSTTFLPFNKGNNGGRGNPPALHAYATAYLWEEIWTRASILDLIEHFVMLVEVEDDNGKKTGEKKLIFPRYHQLDTVRRLRAASRTSGAGHRYLIQHSAGSGKSNSIVWLAYQLATLHDAEDRRVFDSVIVITDRRILDRQLQRNMIQFERTPGVLENIDTTSRKLKTALEDGKTIIVCTLQKFLVIAGEMKELAGERFAVIVDEAHSSQGKGAATSGVTRVLTAGGTNAAPDDEEEQTVDADEPARQAVLKRHFARNASYFAFTATPKKQTLELFGTPDADGKYHPFSLYSMRQAIEEGFILDVLKNYITFATYFNLLKKIEADPHVDRARAARVLKAAAESNPRAIERKAAIMLEHFMTQVYDRRLMDGRAKGMIVTGSRLSAVHYKLAIDAAITARATASGRWWHSPAAWKVRRISAGPRAG